MDQSSTSRSRIPVERQRVPELLVTAPTPPTPGSGPERVAQGTERGAEQGTGTPRLGGVPSATVTALLTAAERLRHAVAELSLSFAAPGVEQAREERDDILARLDTFVLPRLRRADAPLLVVVGGSAGSGKSTLTNSLVGARVSPEGVLRPTTRVPVLAHHPRDASSFLSRRVLPGLTRTAGGEQPEKGEQGSAETIQVVPHWAVTPGLAVIDSPDLNSWMDGNRELARQLFGVADLWVFVATGTDYANAAPWELLTEAVERQVSVAVVLNRMRESEATDVKHHFATMLRDAGLSSAAFFTLPETTLTDDGLLPSWRLVNMQTWLAKQVVDAHNRDGHVRRAVLGTLQYVGRHAETLLAGVRGQAEAEAQLRHDLAAARDRAILRLLGRVGDGSLIDAGVEASWRRLAESQEPAGRASRWLSRSGPEPGRPATPDQDEAAERLRASITVALRAEAVSALAWLADRWYGNSAVERFVDEVRLFTVPDRFEALVGQSLGQWQDQTPGVGVQTLAIGADAGWIGPVARTLAESVQSRGEAREQTRRAGEDLRRRLRELVAASLGRPQAMLDEIGLGPNRPREFAAAVNALREALLTVPARPLP